MKMFSGPLLLSTKKNRACNKLARFDGHIKYEEKASEDHVD